MTPTPQWRSKVSALAAREVWIMDGTYGSSLDLRLPRADTVIWFDYPTLRCLSRVGWRIATTYGRVRPDLAPGCPEQIDWKFLRFVWDFNSKSRPQIVAALHAHLAAPTALVVFKTDREAQRFLADAGRTDL